MLETTNGQLPITIYIVESSEYSNPELTVKLNNFFGTGCTCWIQSLSRNLDCKESV